MDVPQKYVAAFYTCCVHCPMSKSPEKTETVLRYDRPWFVGVDLAGANNTWVAAVALGRRKLSLALKPQPCDLPFLIELVRRQPVLGCAIDAPLSLSLTDHTGLRSSDRQLRSIARQLARDHGQPASRLISWVASFNFLMAVPIRARLLAEALQPHVPMLFETHPRLNMAFVDPALLPLLQTYKSKQADDAQKQSAAAELWRRWSARFAITGSPSESADHDGAIDALVCATAAAQLHRTPQSMCLLPHDADACTGGGPFIVFEPAGSKK